MSNRPPVNQTRTVEEKQNIILDYVLTGSYRKTGRNTSTPESSVRDIIKSEAGQELLATLRAANEESFKVRAQHVIDQAIDRTLETIGDADCKTAATVGAIYYDKLRLAEAKPSRITDNAGVANVIAQLHAAGVAAIEAYAQDRARIIDVTPNPGQIDT
jgi:uncharacterized protein YyaL (SSP411 family)